MTKTLILLISLLMVSSCIKTADQVQREKRMESMSEQMKDSQGLVAEIHGQLKDMQHQLDKMNGRVEELEHRQKQVNPDQFNKMSETLNLMKTQQENEATQLQQIQAELKEQRSFIEKVTASLAAPEAAPKSSKKKSAKSELNSALEQVTNGKYAPARSTLEELIDHPDLTPGEKNKVLHALGRVEYHTKNYEKALTYFSKVYTKYPKATIAPNCLLYIGRTLKKMGKKDEASEAFAKVSEDYPGSKESEQAKKE